MLGAPRPVLLYDGDCRLCRFAARAVARLDHPGQLRLLPFGDEEAAPLLRELPEDERLETWRLVADGATFGYGSGAIELLSVIRITRPAARVLGFVPAAALDALYRLVARHRGRLGRLVPDGPAPRSYS